MAEPQINTLEAKRQEIETYIRATEKRLAQARADLAHVNVPTAGSVARQPCLRRRLLHAASSGN